MPGPYDYENGICYISENDKYESLYGVNVKHEIARSLGIAHQHIRMKNDAACFLEGEVFAGAAQGFSRAAGVTLGTGVGSAYFCNGVATDAEWWNRPFKDSIAELYFSTRWFVKRYYELTGKSVVNVKELIQQENVECVAVIFDEFSKNLSILLADLVCAHDPEVLVIGGNITKAADFFLSQVQDQLYDRKINVGIRISHLGEGAAIIGASTCWN
jgi:glucokinase